MFKLNDDNKVVKTVDVEYGDAVETAVKIQALQLEISKLKASFERAKKEMEARVPALEADVTELVKYGKLSILPDILTDEQKTILISTGVRSLKDFPGNDWLKDYVVGENGV